MTTITTKTYKATLRQDGTVLVAGLHAAAITSPYPDTTRAYEWRDELRDQIIRKLRAAAPAWDGFVAAWER
jgi:microcystin degradation protein MlrC